MSKDNLKSLNWEALLNNSSDDEYDSDETMCEEEVVGVNAIIRKGFQAKDSLTTTVNRSVMEPQAKFENGPGIFSNKTVMPKDGSRNSYKQCKENVNESGRSEFLRHSTTTSEAMINCNNYSCELFSDMTTKSKDIKTNFEVIDGRNLRSSKVSPDVMIMFNNYTDASESTIGFSDMSLNSKRTEENLVVSHKNGFPKPLEVTPDALDSYNNCNDPSESTFGFTDMTLECTEYESKLKTEASRSYEEQEQLLNGSDKKDRSLRTEQHVLNKSDCVKQLLCSKVIGLPNEQIELQTSDNTLNSDQSTNSKMFSNILHDFELEKELSSDTNNHNLVGQLNQKNEILNLDPVDLDFTGNLVHADNVSFSIDTTDYVAHSFNEIQQDIDNSSLQTENCFLGISTESLENIIGSNFIEETFEDVSVSKRNICSPPLTLIEKTNKNNITSKKNLPHKRTRNKRDIPEKILPVRTCQSKYVNQSKRCTSTELEEPTESSWNSHSSKITKIRARKATKDISLEENKNNENTEVNKVIGRKIRRDTKKMKLKAFPGVKSSQNEKTMKVSLLQNLKEMEQSLYQIEQKIYKWVHGDEEHFVSREEAFDMLMETQGIVKILESFKVPMRCRGKMTETKSKLCERAKKLALAIDAAIAESDKMFRQECYEKLLDDKSIESFEETAEFTVAQKINAVNHPKFTPCKGSTENSFNCHIYENSSGRNSVMQQVQQGGLLGDVQKAHIQYTNKEDSGGSLLIWTPVPEIVKENCSLTKQNQTETKNNPKSILKYSSRESTTEKCVSNGKHISFSDDIELRYLSGSTSSSLPSSGQTSSQSQSSFETDRNDTKIHETENITQNSMHYPDPVTNQNTLRTNSLILDEMQEKETFDQFESACSTVQEKLNGKSARANFEVQESVVEKERSEESVLTMSRKIPYDFNLLKINDVTQLQKLSSNDIADVEGTITSVKENSPSSLSHSENLSEGFGFSEEPLQTNQLIWGDVSIMDIKYLRVKSPAEFTPVEEDDDKWLEDLDKW